ncbi:methyltransferase-domain-containing protein [Amylocystis lapponica]|nr:methyltransferase-domain-containing protein [Amylocystis lapponica]
MALFQVPGWSVPAAPVSEHATHSRKRKRGPAKDEDKVSSAELKSAALNIEKLMKSLEAGDDAAARSPKTQNKKHKGETPRAGDRSMDSRQKVSQSTVERKGKEKKGVERREKRKGVSSGAVASREQDKDDLGSPPKRKHKKGTHVEPQSEKQTLQPAPRARSASPEEKGKTRLTVLQAGMKQSLDGARFRWINELLYKSDSTHAHQMMRENHNVFEEYHTGFRRQVLAWPTNPVAHYAAELARYPPRTVIADLGCGDAALARELLPKGLTVLSFDLVSDDTYVIEADTCVRIPLPGSEGVEGEDPTAGVGHVVDVAVCALSLMGTNWPQCVREAWRVLKLDGELKIAEVASRFTDIDAFVKLICATGFRLESKDTRNTHFTLFEFKKITRRAKSDKELVQLMSRGDILKPCEYKRR